MTYVTDKDGLIYQLQRCPFCGMDVADIVSQTEMMEERQEEPYEHAERYSVVCDFHKRGCGATCGYHESVAEAVKRWNTRVII